MAPAAAAVAVVVVACGGGDHGAGEVGGGEPTLVGECGGVRITLPFDGPQGVLDPYERAVGELVPARLAADPGTEVEFGPFEDPAIRWFVAAEGDDSLTLLGVEAEAAPGQYLYIGADGPPEARELNAWGGCEMSVTAEGYGSATVQLATEPQAGDTSLVLDAVEVACASGETPLATGREVVPVVTEDAGAVDVVLLVETVGGPADCPSNPPFEVTVDLAEPVGDRVIRDASVVPPVELPWPPAALSGSFDG